MDIQVKLPEPGTRTVILKQSIKCGACAVSKLFIASQLSASVALKTNFSLRDLIP